MATKKKKNTKLKKMTNTKNSKKVTSKTGNNPKKKDNKKTTKKDKDKKDKKKKDEAKKKGKAPKSKGIYSTPKPYSISRVGLEVYRTDEENFKPYVSSGVMGATPSADAKKEDEDAEDTEEDTEEEEEPEEEETDNQGFKFHQGEILDTYYYGNLQSEEHEYDYKDMSDGGSLKLESVDKMRFYKGVRVCLKGQWEEPNTHLKWDDLEEALTGFIIEQTFTESGTSIKLAGYSKLLDQEFKFEFTQMKRSEILSEIIKTAGMNPVIDVEGLDDDVIDFTNVSSDKGSDVEGGQGAEIDSLVKKWCKGKSSDLDKAQAVHAGLRDDVGIVYQKYYNSQYHTPQNCLKHAHDPGLNCGDTSILTTACMKSAGLNAYIVLRCDNEHFFTVIEIGGTKYYSDLTANSGQRSQRPWNEVWEGNTCGSKYDLS